MRKQGIMLALAILLARALNGSIMGKISIRRSRKGLCIATTMIMDHYKYVQNSSFAGVQFVCFCRYIFLHASIRQVDYYLFA